MAEQNTHTNLRSIAHAVLRILPWLWLGIAIGISGIETPIRFRTPPITRDGAAMLGVAIFHALAYIELVMLVVVMGAAIFIRDRWIVGLVAVLGFVVAIEHTLVVPVLTVRAHLLVQGAHLEPSSVHAWATALEATKMIVLGAIGIRHFRLG